MSDWPELGRRLSKIMAAMMHQEHTDLHGDEFYGEALSRLWDQVAHGYVTQEQHGRTLDVVTYFDRANLDAAQAQLATERERYAATMAEAARACAQVIRSRARSVPSRYRREGALQAACWLDPRDNSTDRSSDGATQNDRG